MNYLIGHKKKILSRSDDNCKCILTIIVFIIIHSCIMYYTFMQYINLTIIDYGYARMTASKYFSDKDIKLIAPIESSLWFYLHVWSIWDVKGVLTLGNTGKVGDT